MACSKRLYLDHGVLWSEWLCEYWLRNGFGFAHVLKHAQSSLSASSGSELGSASSYCSSRDSGVESILSAASSMATTLAGERLLDVEEGMADLYGNTFRQVKALSHLEVAKTCQTLIFPSK